MKLDINFNALTKLSDWWKQVQDNFKIIESESNKTREIAESALTGEEAEQYMTSFISSIPEYQDAIESFTAIMEENGNSVEALEEVFHERLKYYRMDAEFDVTTAKSDDAIYFCCAGTLNTPDEGNGILLTRKDGVFCWLSDTGRVYCKNGNEWVSTDVENENKIADINNNIQIINDTKCEVVFGMYEGDDAEERFIDLGFTPAAVEVYTMDGQQGGSITNTMYYKGGIAFLDNPAYITWAEKDSVVEICEGGFKVYYRTIYNASGNSVYIHSNRSLYKYYFKAYKNGEIMEV